MCAKLSQELAQCGKSFKAIYGIPRGGLPIAVHLSHLMGIQMDLEGVKEGDLQYIVVDDINDTGRTMESCKDTNCVTVVLFERVDSKVKADFVGEYINHNDWLIFPWEDAGKAFEDMLEYLEEGTRDAVYQERQTRQVNQTN